MDKWINYVTFMHFDMLYATWTAAAHAHAGHMYSVVGYSVFAIGR